MPLHAAGLGAGASHVGEPPGSPGGVPLAHPDATPLEESTIEHAAARSAGAGVALLGVLVLGAGLQVWRLDQQGWGNEYYTAAVRSMASSWHNLLFNSPRLRGALEDPFVFTSGLPRRDRGGARARRGAMPVPRADIRENGGMADRARRSVSAVRTPVT
ncbi:MAG: hypothetical protein ABW020_13370 [Candidatus Rokuibacteriota bacterium]